jgi:hypothetical protein
LEEKGGCLQAGKQQLNHDARGWQHHDVGCFTAGGTGALHKIDSIMRKDNYVDILKQHLKTSVRELKLGRKWVFHMDNDPKHTSKVVANGFRTTESRYWSVHHKALTSIL